jgi:hypothetical protein
MPETAPTFRPNSAQLSVLVRAVEPAPLSARSARCREASIFDAGPETWSKSFHSNEKDSDMVGGHSVAPARARRAAKASAMRSAPTSA